jgi:hypothetical protein
VLTEARRECPEGCAFVFSDNGRKPISGLDPSPWLENTKPLLDDKGEAVKDHKGKPMRVPVLDDKERRTYIRTDRKDSSQCRVVRRIEALGVLQEDVDQWQPHDVRRTSSTLLAALKCPEVIRDRGILNHQPKKLDRTYNIHDYFEEKKEWLARLADKLVTLGLKAATAA